MPGMAKQGMGKSRSAFGSSNVANAEYVQSERTLYVQFISGPTYAYREVPGNTAAAFFAAPSKGQFVHRILRPGYRADVTNELGTKRR
jgi:hypothetical protein